MCFQLARELMHCFVRRKQGYVLYVAAAAGKECIRTGHWHTTKVRFAGWKYWVAYNYEMTLLRKKWKMFFYFISSLIVGEIHLVNQKNLMRYETCHTCQVISKPLKVWVVCGGCVCCWCVSGSRLGITLRWLRNQWISAQWGLNFMKGCTHLLKSLRFTVHYSWSCLKSRMWNSYPAILSSSFLCVYIS